jgi:hypothetical protein
MTALLAAVLTLAIDGGVVQAGKVKEQPKVRVVLSREDEEVAANLELLEHLDAMGDLELMQELSVER